VPPQIVAKAKRIVAERPGHTELVSLDLLAKELEVGVLERVDVAVRQHIRGTEPRSIDQLAREFGIHERTL